MAAAVIVYGIVVDLRMPPVRCVMPRREALCENPSRVGMPRRSSMCT